MKIKSIAGIPIQTQTQTVVPVISEKEKGLIQLVIMLIKNIEIAEKEIYEFLEENDMEMEEGHEFAIVTPETAELLQKILPIVYKKFAIEDA